MGVEWEKLVKEEPLMKRRDNDASKGRRICQSTIELTEYVWNRAIVRAMVVQYIQHLLQIIDNSKTVSGPLMPPRLGWDVWGNFASSMA